ncbi:MAG: hypothetical protein IJI22_05490 [Bacilli bacterium]|nr:hypothetical protein [Bacilli bacterium]
MEVLKTTNEKIEEVLKQKGTIMGKGKNKFITWNVTEADKCLYSIAISLRSGKIIVKKYLDNEEYINHGKTMSYQAQYDPEQESFQIEIRERVLNDSHDGDYTENKYFISKDKSLLVKKYNDILVQESLIDGWKHFSYTDYDLTTMQENTSFSCNLNPANKYANGKYTTKIGKKIYLFNHGICQSPTAHVYVGGKKVQKNYQVFKNLDHHVDYLKYRVSTGDIYIDLFIGYFIEEIARAVKKNPEGYEGTIDEISVPEKLLLEFDEHLRVKLKTLAQSIPFCDLYKMLYTALSRDKEKVYKK